MQFYPLKGQQYCKHWKPIPMSECTLLIKGQQYCKYWIPIPISELGKVQFTQFWHRYCKHWKPIPMSELHFANKRSIGSWIIPGVLFTSGKSFTWSQWLITTKYWLSQKINGLPSVKWCVPSPFPHLIVDFFLSK